MSNQPLFPLAGFSGSTSHLLHQQNPWWSNNPQRVLPKYKRTLFQTVLSRLQSGLAPITVLRGPRQVGKTTIQEQVIQHLLDIEQINPHHIFRVQFDELTNFEKIDNPILELAWWFQDNILKQGGFNAVAHHLQPAYLFFDEVQNLQNWAPQLKSLVDSYTVRILVTGSSALRIEQGRDSLAGRIQTLELGTLNLTEIANLRNIASPEPILNGRGVESLRHKDAWLEIREHAKRSQAICLDTFAWFARYGGYPLAHINPSLDWGTIATQLNETVIKRVIQHDLRVGEAGRKRDEKLLEELFRLVCRYAGQAPTPHKLSTILQEQLQANIGVQRVTSYLQFLHNALLIRQIAPLELRLKRQKSAAKLCLCDHGLRASWLQEQIPLDTQQLSENPLLSDLAGHLAESIVGNFFASLPNVELAWFPERSPDEPEIDFVLTTGYQRIPLEVKYRNRIKSDDLLGLQSFLNKPHNQAPFGILITFQETDLPERVDPRIVSLPLSSLLFAR
jgi:predicted AAA+ superfamily ATPase